MSRKKSLGRLDRFRQEVDWNLAVGALADVDLPVTDDDGASPVVVAFDDERYAVLLGRVRAVGGYANVFVKGPRGVRAIAVIRNECAVGDAGEQMLGAESPDANATVGMFLDYVELQPNGVAVSAAVGQPACARDARPVDFVTAT
ncbi:hypothetical protein [Mycobacterium avium]|nr:hypothetical protein [Mycobacterium avium]